MRIREHFNPRAPCGARLPPCAALCRGSLHFNPRAPCGARRARGRRHARQHRHFNPRAPCGARLGISLDEAFGISISTHAPLAGRDCSPCLSLFPSMIFQPTRPLRGATYTLAIGSSRSTIFQPTRPLRGATQIGFTYSAARIFQPTRPLRGATIGTGPTIFPTWDFNPRAPCGARRRIRFFVVCLAQISTHAPLAGRDFRQRDVLPSSNRFQPTRPLRGATGDRGTHDCC